MKKQDWKRLRKQDLPQTVFFAIMIISAGLVVLPMWNYTKYYLALNNFDYTLTKVAIHTNQLYPPTSTIAKINITFTASNPTDYSGLQISTVGYDLEYYGDYHLVELPPVTLGGQIGWMNTSMWELTSASTPPTQLYSIGPHTNTAIVIETSISGNSGKNALDFITYLESLSKGSEPNQIHWSINCRLDLNTFLGTFARPKSFSPVTPWNSSTT